MHTIIFLRRLNDTIQAAFAIEKQRDIRLQPEINDAPRALEHSYF